MELRKTVMLFEDVAAELVVEVGESLVIWLKSSRGSIVVRGMFVAGPFEYETTCNLVAKCVSESKGS